MNASSTPDWTQTRNGSWCFEREHQHNGWWFERNEACETRDGLAEFIFLDIDTPVVLGTIEYQEYNFACGLTVAGDIPGDAADALLRTCFLVSVGVDRPDAVDMQTATVPAFALRSLAICAAQAGSLAIDASTAGDGVAGALGAADAAVAPATAVRVLVSAHASAYARRLRLSI